MLYCNWHGIQGYDIKEKGKNGYWEAISNLLQTIVRMSES